MQTALLSQAELIQKAKEAGFVFAWGDPTNRIRYWSTIGLIPHAIRRGGVGHYPDYTVSLLLRIQELQKQGLPIESIKAIVNREEVQHKVRGMLEEEIEFSNEPVQSVQLSTLREDDPKPVKQTKPVLIAFIVCSLFLLAGASIFGAYRFIEDRSLAQGGLVLAGFDAAKILEFNADSSFQKNFDIRGTILNLAGTVINLNQSLRTVDAPSFTDLTINNTVGEITFPQAAGVVLLDQATQTITNKSISGSTNTLTSISNSALSNSSITINTSGNLSGGGSVSLGGSISLSASGGGTTSTASAGYLTLQTSGGNLGNSVLSQNGTTLVVDGVSAVTVGTASCVITTNGVVTNTGSCPSGGGSKWQLNSGVLAPNDTTQSLVIGGTATSSGKFQVYGVSALDPVASISASSSKAAFMIDNTVGDLFTASSSGMSRFVITQGGNVGIGTTQPNNLIQVANLINFNNTATSTFLGYQAGNSSTGLGNTAVGYNAGFTLDSTSDANVMVGNHAGYRNIGDKNTFVGASAGYGFSAGVSATENTAVGYFAGSNLNTGGDYNAFLGNYAGTSVRTGTQNVILGYNADVAYTSLANSIGIGANVYLNGDQSIALGAYARVDANNTMVVGSQSYPITDIYFGNISRNAGAAAPSGAAINATGGFGSDIAGANLTLAGGKATGNATGGSLIFSTSIVGTTGSTLQTLGERMRINSSGLVGINTTSPAAIFDVRGVGTQTLSGIIPVASISGRTSFATLVVDNSGVGDLFTASSSGLNRFVITQNGGVGINTKIVGKQVDVRGAVAIAQTGTGGAIDIEPLANGAEFWTNTSYDSSNPTSGWTSTMALVNGNVGIGSTTASSQLHVWSSAGATTGVTVQNTNGGGNPFLRVQSASNRSSNIYVNSGGTDILSFAVASDSTFGQMHSASGFGLRFYTNGGSLVQTMDTNGNVGIGSATPNSLLHVYGASTTQVASVSASTGKAALLVDNTVGDLFAASSSGLNRFVITQNGNVGIGTSQPGQMLYVENPISTGPSQITVRSGSSNAVLNLRRGTTDLNIAVGNGSGFVTGSSNGDTQIASAQSIFINAGGGGTAKFLLSSGGLLGINTTSPAGIFDVRGVGVNTLSGITPVATISGQTSFAAMVVDNQGVGDLFTASSSGLNRFVIKQNGNVGIGVDVPDKKLSIAGDIRLSYNGGVDGLRFLALTGGQGNNILVDGTGGLTIGAGADAGSSITTFSNGGGVNSVIKIQDSGFADDIILHSGGSSYFNGGNLGIGTTAPVLLLDVAGSQAATGTAMIRNTNTGADSDGLIVKLGFTGVGSTTNSFVTFLDGEGRINGLIRANGANNVAYQTQGIADFGEYMKSEAGNIPVGTVVCQGEIGVKPCTTSDGIAGVVSDTTAFLGGEATPDSVIVGFLGQVFVKTSENGLKAGDPITVFGGKAKKSGAIIGYAVKNQVGDKILVLLRPGFAQIDEQKMELPKLDLLSLQNDNLNIGTVAGNLKVTGLTELAETSIGGKLTVGLLVFDDLDADVSSLGEKLSIQNGSVLIGKNGDITTSGNIEAKSVSVEKINVLGEQISTNSGLIKASIGTAVIESGEVTKLVQTTSLTNESKIFVTPVGKPVAVSATKVSSDAFEIRIKEPIDEPISINWWVVN